MSKITQGMAREFYRDLCGTVNGNADKTCQGVLPVDEIAERMGISTEKANEFLWACAKYGITERQGGMWVV